MHNNINNKQAVWHTLTMLLGKNLGVIWGGRQDPQLQGFIQQFLNT